MSVRRKAIGLLAVSLLLLLCLYHTNSPLLKAHSTRPTRPHSRHILPSHLALGGPPSLLHLGLISLGRNDGVTAVKNPLQKDPFKKKASSGVEEEDEKLRDYSEMTNGLNEDDEDDVETGMSIALWDEEDEEEYDNEEPASVWQSRYSEDATKTPPQNPLTAVGRKMSHHEYPQEEYPESSTKNTTKESHTKADIRNTKGLTASVAVTTSDEQKNEVGNGIRNTAYPRHGPLLRGNLSRGSTSTSSPPKPLPGLTNKTADAPHLPDVLIIGAKKAGTRALLEFLRIHPLVRAAKQELHFFDRHYHLGPSWYRRQLPPRRPGQLTVEKTPAYLVSPTVPGRVRHLLPRARLLLVVREPATRALSDYTQGVIKRSAHRSFSDLVFSDRPTGLVNVNWGPVAGGLYARHLQRWLRYFPQTSIHVVGGEDLVHHPAQEMQKVEKFLGLPPFILPEHFVFNRTKGFPCVMRQSSPSPEPGAENEQVEGGSDRFEFPLDLKGRERQPMSPDVSPALSIIKSSSSHTLLNPLDLGYLNASLSKGTLLLRAHCLGSTKGRDHPEVDPESFKILQEFYRPFNHKFFRMIGRKFDWN